MRIQRIAHGQKDPWRIDVYVCMYIHQILVRRISHGNHSYCTNKMADGFRFRLRRGSCADLVSSLELMEPGDEGGRIVPNWFRIPRFLISETSNFDDWENIDDLVINTYRSKRTLIQRLNSNLDDTDYSTTRIWFADCSTRSEINAFNDVTRHPLTRQKMILKDRWTRRTRTPRVETCSAVRNKYSQAVARHLPISIHRSHPARLGLS